MTHQTQHSVEPAQNSLPQRNRIPCSSGAEYYAALAQNTSRRRFKRNGWMSIFFFCFFPPPLGVGPRFRIAIRPPFHLLLLPPSSQLHSHSCTPSQLHPHTCTLTVTLSQLHPRSCTLEIAPSQLHPHNCTLAVAPSKFHPHSCTPTFASSQLHTHNCTP